MPEEKHILVVEDDEELCTAVVEALRDAGYKALGCQTARDAIHKLKNQAYACILLDMVLGEESGENIVDAVRGHKSSLNFRTPLLVISGHLQKDLVKRIARQIHGALVKPFEMKALLEHVEKLAGKPSRW